MGSTKNKLKNFCWPLRVVLLFGMLKMYFFISLDYSKLRDIFFSNICNQVHIHYLISGTMRREGLGGFSPPLWGNVHACSTYTHSWLCNPHKNMPIEKFPRRSTCSGPVPSFWRYNIEPLNFGCSFHTANYLAMVTWMKEIIKVNGEFLSSLLNSAVGFFLTLLSLLPITPLGHLFCINSVAR